MKKFFALLMFTLCIMCFSCQMDPDFFDDGEEVETDNENYLNGVDAIGSLTIENQTGKNIVIVRFTIDKKSYKIGNEIIYDSTLGKEVDGISDANSVTLRMPAGKGSVSFFFPDSGKKQTLLEKVEVKPDETTTVTITNESKVRVEYYE